MALTVVIVNRTSATLVEPSPCFCCSECTEMSATSSHSGFTLNDTQNHSLEHRALSQDAIKWPVITGARSHHSASWLFQSFFSCRHNAPQAVGLQAVHSLGQRNATQRNVTYRGFNFRL